MPEAASFHGGRCAVVVIRASVRPRSQSLRLSKSTIGSWPRPIELWFHHPWRKGWTNPPLTTPSPIQCQNPWTLCLSCSRISSHASTVDLVVVEGVYRFDKSRFPGFYPSLGQLRLPSMRHLCQSRTTETREGGVDSTPCRSGG